jgi:hypothetical protein
MSERERLPDRRLAELFDFEHGGRKWTVTVGRFSDGRVAEIFLDAAKTSSLVALAQESAIIASIALQFGADVSTIRHAIESTSAGPLSTALDLAALGVETRGAAR